MRFKPNKITITILVLLIFAITLTGCGLETKLEKDTREYEMTVNGYLSAAQNYAIAEMITMIDPANTKDIQIMSNIESGENSATFYYSDYMKDNAAKMTYKIVGGTIIDDEAIAMISADYVDGSDVVTAVMKESENVSPNAPLQGQSREDFLAGNIELFKEIVDRNAATIPGKEKTIMFTMNLIKMGDIWYVANITNEMMDVQFSGFSFYAKEADEEIVSDTLKTTKSTQLLREAQNCATLGVEWAIKDIASYLDTGLSYTGQKINLQETIVMLDVAMIKKNKIDRQIENLDKAYSSAKTVWKEFSVEADRIYENIKLGTGYVDYGHLSGTLEVYKNIVSKLEDE